MEWHRTSNGDLEARGPRKWRITTKRTFKGKAACGYRLSLNGVLLGESDSIKALMAMAEQGAVPLFSVPERSEA